MTAPSEPRTEPAPASQAPAVIHLPPPAEPAPAKVRRRGGGAGRHFGPRPVADPRSAWLSTRCTPAFLAQMRAEAKEAGLTLADYIHARLGVSPGPRARRRPSEATKIIAQLVAQMGRPGSNLNQGARALNQIKLAAPEVTNRDRLADLIEDMAELHWQAIAEHRECLAAVMRNLGMRPDDDY